MRVSTHLYDHPEYYDFAFSFRDMPAEAEVFDECISRYSKIPVRRVLELAAGTAPHLEEWAKKRVEYIGIDTNEIMLDYTRKKAQKLRAAATLLKEDIRSFSLDNRVDFAYILLGSLQVITTEEINSHFSSVARALNPGGLYFLDWCINFEWADASRSTQSWSIDSGPVKADVSFRTERLSRADQTVRNILTARINDGGKLLSLEETWVARTIFPQEFLLLVEKSEKFEFVGWWNHWNLEEPIDNATTISRPIALLRRRDL